jgi:GntR family transcriptional repressor for pyruvate dehydrogenase complex
LGGWVVPQSGDGASANDKAGHWNFTGSFTSEILRVIAGSRRPLGADSVYFILRDLGIRVSAPTIGRRMRECEARGLLKKVSVEGRVITPTGLKALRGSDRSRQLRVAGEALLNALEKKGKDELVDLLVARRSLEREAARLAARNATPDDTREMDEVLRDQEARIASAELGVDQDIRFHELVAKASQNIFLEALISLLRRHGEYAYAITKIRSMSGNRLVADHWVILDAIRKHDSTKAALAVESHIDKLIVEVNNWRGKSAAARRLTKSARKSRDLEGRRARRA